MMPVIRIPDPVFERLQTLAKPFVDTPGSVIEKLLDFYESHRKDANRAAPLGTARNSTIKTFSCDTPPDLRHTRILSAQLDGQTAANWNELVHLAHRRAIARLKSFEALRSATQSNIAVGRKSDRGFHYLADINVSIQNVDANLAWRNILKLARKLRLPLRVEFEWRHSEGAAHPGQQGQLSLDSSGLPVRVD